MSNPSGADLAALVGARIKVLRNAKGLSGRKVAAAAEVSQPFLSQLESGQTSVSLSTLYRISNVLGVAVPDLLSDPPKESMAVHRRSDFTEVSVSEGQESATGLALFRAGQTINELFDYLIQPNEHISEWFETAGEHAVICMEGSLRVEFESDEDVVLAAGDVLVYTGPNRHRWHVESESACRIFLISVRG